MRPFEIYWGNGVQWGKNCTHDHMWVIVDIRNDLFGCFPISSSCYGGDCFEVSENHDDFPATGLRHTSQIIYTSIVELSADELRDYQGELTNELLAEFREQAGV